MEHIPILKIAALHFMAGLIGRAPTPCVQEHPEP
jgi:hypothetical protein